MDGDIFLKRLLTFLPFNNDTPCHLRHYYFRDGTEYDSFSLCEPYNHGGGLIAGCSTAVHDEAGTTYCTAAIPKDNIHLGLRYSGGRLTQPRPTSEKPAETDQIS